MKKKKMTNPNGSIPDYEGLGGLAGGIPVFGGLIDTFVQSDTARRNTDKTIEAQRREAELAYQRSVEMWHMQNAYNSPQQQMARFGAAGLNPHLIYGQGSAGNSSGTPEYHAPNIQYRYAAPQAGAAISSMVPMLMQVGSWMQNMRLTETEIQSKETGIDKLEQAIRFLEERNPRELSKLDNSLSMYPYQKALQRSLGERGNIAVSEMLEEFRYKWGTPLNELEFGEYNYVDRMKGLRGQQLLKAIAEQKLKSAQASWTEYGVTNPQQLMQMVMGAVLNMAGINRRAPMTKRIPHKGFSPKKITTRYDSKGRRSYQRVE